MAYVELAISSGHVEVDRLYQDTIEPLVREAHYLMAATWPSDGPHGHFHHSSAIVLLATVAATSALSNYKRGTEIRKGDRESFVRCLRTYLPWNDIQIEDGEYRSIEDGEYRSKEELVDIASRAMYEHIRCPMFHSGGLVAGSDQRICLVKSHPGTPDSVAAEQRIEELAKKPSLSEQTLIRFESLKITLYIDPLYWCVRKLVENAASDTEHTQAIREHSRR